MFTNKTASYYSQDKVLIEAACLSTDTKPTTGVANGSKCIEMDTGKTYMFNEEDSEWEELPSSGGGGGGSSDFSTAEVTVVNNSSELDWANIAVYSEPYNSLIADYGEPSSGTYTMPLYKGSLILSSNGSGDVSVSGACEYTDDQFIITGDCTITIS